MSLFSVLGSNPGSLSAPSFTPYGSRLAFSQKDETWCSVKPVFSQEKSLWAGISAECCLCTRQATGWRHTDRKYWTLECFPSTPNIQTPHATDHCRCSLNVVTFIVFYFSGKNLCKKMMKRNRSLNDLLDGMWAIYSINILWVSTCARWLWKGQRGTRELGTRCVSVILVYLGKWDL